MKPFRIAPVLSITPLAAALALSAPATAQEPTSPSGERPASGCELVSVVDHGPTPAPAPAGAPLSVSVTFNANVTNAQRAVCLQAVADWQAVVESNGQLASPYPLHFENGPLGVSATGANLLARATTTWNVSSGMLVSSVIRIDNDGTSAFFVDPTPGESSEFDGFGSCTSSSVCGNFDLLTVMRHEVGHAIGWTGFFSNNGNPPNVLPGGLMSGTTFDPSRLNVPCDPAATAHSNATVFPGGLMNPGLAAGTRVGIATYPDLAVIGRAYQNGVRARFVDSTSSGSGSGNATNPYTSFSAAESSAPAGYPIVVASGNYAASNLFLSSPHLFVCAWNAVAVIQ